VTGDNVVALAGVAVAMIAAGLGLRFGARRHGSDSGS
jgi:hypothetical protein